MTRLRPGWLPRMPAICLALALGAGGWGPAAWAQVRPVTGIMAYYDTVADTNGNYSVRGGGSGDYPTGTTYNLTFNSGSQNNLVIRGFETGTNVYNYVQLAQRINIVRVDNPMITGRHNIVFFEEDSVAGTNVNLRPSLVATMINSLRSDLVNRGADNVFANQGDGNGNNNNIERIDYIFASGFPYYNFTDQRGFLVMDRGGNDRFKIAVITGLGTNGLPSAFSRPVSVLDTDWGPSGITLETTVMRGYTEDGAVLRPSARTTVQSLSGVYLSWDQFDLTTNDMVYGYGLAANDVSTNGAHWLQVTNPAYFPTNTTVESEFGGLDLISGGAMFFDEVLDVGVGDRVWDDRNGDGRQDADEPGLSNVLVHIYTSDEVLAATARSDADGYYFAQGMGPGTYHVQFFAPAGYQFSPQYASADPGIDSDPDALSGVTEGIPLGSGATNLYVDAGLFLTPGDLRLDKTVTPTNVNVGDEIIFTLAVTNAGTPAVNLIQVRDLLPAAFVHAGHGASAGTFDPGAGLWDLGPLAPGAAATLVITGTVNWGAGGSVVTNTARIERMDRPDTNTADNAAAAVFTVQAADLAVAKTADRAEMGEGDPVVFTVAVANVGPYDVSGLEIDDRLPAGLAFDSAAASVGSYDAGTGVWSIGVLTNGGAATLEITATAVIGAGGLILTNTAAVGAASHEDPELANNSAAAVVTIYGADLALAKTVAPPAAVEGQTVEYTLTVVNPGPSEATGIMVSEPLTNGLVYAAHAASQGTYSSGTGLWTVGSLGVQSAATLRITATVGGGTLDTVITNRARIVANDLPDPDADNDEATAELSISSLVLTKASDVDVTVHPGDTITYTVAASNAGGAAHANVTLYDLVPAGATFVPGSLAVSCEPADSTTVVYTASGSFEVPPGVTSVVVDAWGGGGGGGRARGNPATGGGGAGGSYARKTVAVVPLQSYAVTVGAGGIGGNGTGIDTQHGRSGNPSWFGSTNTVFAQGGARGLSDGNISYYNGAAGAGAAALCVGDVVYRGGHGGFGRYHSGSAYYSGAGGGGAGTSGTGGDALTNGVRGAGTALYGGNGAAGVTNNRSGNAGTEYGGGGSGGKANTSTDRNGGSGADGLVRITYVAGGASADPPDLASDWTLAPGQRLVATFQVLVDDPLELLALTNTATASSDRQPVPVSATVVDRVIHTDLAVGKQASVSVLEEGAGLQFTVTVTNGSLLDAATGVEILDALPAGFDFGSATPSQGDYDSGTGVWGVGTLAPNAGATLVIDATAAAGAGGFRWTNTATVAACDQLDPVAGNDSAQAVVLVAGADLALTKTVDNPTPNETSQVTYTLRLTNAGPADVAGIEVAEPLTAGLAYVAGTASQGVYNDATGIWSVGALAVGEDAVLTLTVAIEVGTLGTTLTNASRIAAADLPDPVAGNNQAAATVQVSGLRVVKTSDVGAYATPGDTVVYTIAVTNVSSIAHTGIAVEDVLAAGTVYVPGSTWIEGPGTNALAGAEPPWLVTNRTLAAGEAFTLTFEAVVVNPGSVTQLLNTAAVMCNQQPEPVIAQVADAVRHTDLRLSKAADDVRPDEGDPVTYTLVLTNAGPNDAASLYVSEPLTNGLNYVSHVAGQGTYDRTTGVWAVGALAVGATAQLEISATVAAGTAGTVLTNRSWISGANMADLLTADNTAVATVSVVSVDIGLSKSANPAAPAENGLVVFTVTATNFGPDAATGVAVTDLLPAGLDYLASEAGPGAYDSGRGVWTVGALAPLQSATLLLTAVVQTNTAGMSLTNTATVTAVDQVDIAAGNDSAQAVVVPGESMLDLVKTAEPAGPVWAGDVITYTLAVTNRSGMTQSNVVVSDPLPAGAVYVAASCRLNAPFTVDETFGDQFSRRVYSNNDGTEIWAGDWIEGEDNGPTAGSIQIQFDNGVDETYTLRFSGGGQNIRRSADLSAYTGAVLEFDYQRIGLEAGEYVAIQIATNGASGWTELARFQGAATDADYIHYRTNITAYISPLTAIRFVSPTGMDSTDILWVDDILITGARRVNLEVAGGSPPVLAADQVLEAGEAMTLQFQVWVANPALVTQIVNQASLTSTLMPDPQIDTVVTPVEACFTIVPTGLHADPTNAFSFGARWAEVDGCFGYRLDVATDPAFGPADYVAGYSNRAVPGDSTSVTGLTHDTLYYFRVRAEWDEFCTSADSDPAAVTTLGLPVISVTPELLDFGVVDIADTSNLVLSVTNSGTETLTISAIEFTGINAAFFAVTPSNAFLPAGSSLELTVIYDPEEGGNDDVLLVIYNDAPDRPEVEVTILGECFDPAMQSPELLAYHVTDAAGLTNEVTDRSLGSRKATFRVTAYHFSGMNPEGAFFDLINPDGTLAFTNAPFTAVEPEELGGRACQRFSAPIPNFFPAALGIYTARVTMASSNGMWLHAEDQYTSVAAGTAVATIWDNFSRVDVADSIGLGWVSRVTGPVPGNIQIRNRVLQLYGAGGTGGDIGRVSVVRDQSSRYDPVLTNNVGTLTWAFNFFSVQSERTGFAPGAYGAAFVLGSDNGDWVGGAGNGYAVRICSNQVALAAFTGGLDLDTDLILLGNPASLASPTSSLSVVVELEAATGVWSLYVRELPGSGLAAFVNPFLGMASQPAARATNTLHLHRALPYGGCYWNHGNAPAGTNSAAFFDDFYAPYVLQISEPMSFYAIDNDIMMPTALGAVCVNEEPVPEEVPDRYNVVWTNAPEFIVTFDVLASDQDPGYSIPYVQRDVQGIGEYRVSADPVNLLSASNRAMRGYPFPVVTTNGALANYGFEMLSQGGDWQTNLLCTYQTVAADPALVFEGTNSLRQAPGGQAWQIFEFRNEAEIVPQVDMTGWYRGGAAEARIAGFTAADATNPVATVVQPLAAAADWTSFTVPKQILGDATVEKLQVTLAATGGEPTYWDSLRFAADIGTNRPSMRFRAGPESQGLVPQYIYAVDADYNRGGDRLAGLTKFFYIPFDMTPPTPVPMPAGGNGATTETVDDPTTQFDVHWSNFGVGPDDPADPVHPTKQAGDIDLMSKWHEYRVFYGIYDPGQVPVNDDPYSTNSYIYKTFIQTGAYRNWAHVQPATAIEDPSAPGFQPDYLALTNQDTTAIRLYDLEYDRDYVVVVAAVDAAGNVGNAGVTSWATNNTIRFALIRGSRIGKPEALAAFPNAPLHNTNAPNAAALYWIASGPTNEQGEYTTVSKDYDLITWDAAGFQESSNNQWQLVDTVRSNWFVDDGGQMQPRGQMRFYRASYKDRWRATNTLGLAQRGLASEEVYALHNVVLSGGQNYVALHGVPYARTLQGVFGGLETFPGGDSALPAAGATLVEFYSASSNAATCDQYWLDSDGRWNQMGGGDVTTTLMAEDFFDRGFSITLPDPLPTNYVVTTAVDHNRLDEFGEPLAVPAMIWSPIMQVPTNGFSQVIQTGSRSGRVSTQIFNIAAFRLPVPAHPGQMGLLESGFVKGFRGMSDEIYTMDTRTKGVLEGSTIYCDPGGTWLFMTDDTPVPPDHFKPNDIIVIVSRNWVGDGTWTWHYHPTNFYSLPTRWMGN